MRVQVNLSDEMVEKVDYYATKMGVTRSSLCSMLIGQGCMAYDKSFEVLQQMKISANDVVLNSLKATIKNK